MNKHLKKIFPLCCAATFSFGVMANSNATTSPLYSCLLQTNKPDNGISPQSDRITWRYKTENGKIYKRQYNCSTGKWIGDWILIS